MFGFLKLNYETAKSRGERQKERNKNSDEAGYIPSGNRREVGLPAALVSSPMPPVVPGEAWDACHIYDCKT